MTSMINLYGYDFKYYYWGNELIKPNPRDVNSTLQEVDAYHSFLKDMNSYENKIDGSVSESPITVVLSLILTLVECSCLFKHLLEPCDFSGFWEGAYTVFWLLVSLSILTIVGYFYYYLFNMPIMCIFVWLIPRKIRVKISKILISKPKWKPCFDKTKKYDELVKDYENHKKELTRLYYGIEKTDYSMFEYGKLKIQELTEKLVDYVRYKNELTKQEINRLSKDYWYKMSPYDFEKEVAVWFEKQGYQALVTKKSGDGGVDIVITKSDYKGYVQCKQFTKSKVDRPTLNALYGVVCADNVSQGVIACLLGVTKEAQEFALRTNMMIVTIDDLITKGTYLNHIRKASMMQEMPLYCNDNWIKIAGVKLKTSVYGTEQLALSFKSLHSNLEEFHVLKYSGLYFVLLCTENVFWDVQCFLNKK